MPDVPELPGDVARGLDDFVAGAREALGDTLVSVVLYGSAAEGALRATSDVNVILVLARFDRHAAERLREPLRVAQAAVRLAAMLVLRAELPDVVAAFAQKFADVLRRRRVLHGEDPFAGLRVPRAALIAQLDQVLLNLALRMRAAFVERGLREEQLAIVVADAAAPLRACAASVLELEGAGAVAPPGGAAARHRRARGRGLGHHPRAAVPGAPDTAAGAGGGGRDSAASRRPRGPPARPRAHRARVSNPFDLPGPQFLVFYAIVGAPKIDTSDPYLIAFLRGGAHEALRVAAVSLIDRGILKGDEKAVVTASPEAAALVRRPLERALVDKFVQPGAPSAIFRDDVLTAACDSYAATLRRQGLLPDDEARAARRRRQMVAFAVLFGLAAAKIAVAVGRGRTNVGFLIVLAALFGVIVWRSSDTFRTARGSALFADLRRLFGRLKARAGSLRPGGATAEAALLAAVFGVSALPAAAFPYARRVYGGRSSGSSDGSWTSSSSGCAGSCGGGGGGGCGGCGGGGD